jgi:hypothetical protein
MELKTNEVTFFSVLYLLISPQKQSKRPTILYFFCGLPGKKHGSNAAWISDMRQSLAKQPLVVLRLQRVFLR